MEYQRKDEIQITIISGSVVTSVGGLASFYDSDWYLNVMLTKSFDLTNYVQINKDSFQYTIDRQKINPYFYELGFLETIDSISYNKENINFWSDIVAQNENLESPALYNTLFNVMKGSLELKSSIFNIQTLPDPIASDQVNVIVDKMNEIKALTESNQIDFVNSNLPK
jgi:hypothetical protein